MILKIKYKIFKIYIFENDLHKNDYKVKTLLI